MKKILLALSAVALLFATSCKKENVNPAIDVPEGSFLATIDNGANPQNAPAVKDGMGTMTIIDDQNYVIWEPDDKIKINGVEYTTNTSGGSALFAPSDPAQQASGTDYHAFYPAGIARTGAAGYLPTSQFYTQGKVSNLPMYAHSTNNQLTFHNICAALKITIPDFLNNEVNSITVSSDQILCGAFNIQNNAAVITETSPFCKSVQIRKPIKYPAELFETGEVVYIPIPANTYTNFTIKFKNSNNTALWQKTLTTCTLDVNKVYNINVTPSDIPVNCFHFTATGNVTIGMTKGSYAPNQINLQYKTYTASNNTYSNWQAFTVGSTTVSLADGDKVYFKAPSTNPNKKFASGTDLTSANRFTSSGTGTLSVNGNIMYLLNSSNPATTLTSNNEYAFTYLFTEMTHLTDASQLILPATTLSRSCYNRMFNNCSTLVNVPALPAETLAPYCYSYMFHNTALTTVPDLPATTLAEGCYYNTFSNCSSLVNVPIDLLPAETLATNCYSNMFSECGALENGPDLPAQTLATNCYQAMFDKCSALTNAPVLPAQTLATNCYQYIFQSCPKLKSVTMKATTNVNQNNLSNWLNNSGYDSSVSSNDRKVHCKSSVQSTVQSTLPTGTYGWTAVGDVQ